MTHSKINFTLSIKEGLCIVKIMVKNVFKLLRKTHSLFLSLHTHTMHNPPFNS